MVAHTAGGLHDGTIVGRGESSCGGDTCARRRRGIGTTARPLVWHRDCDAVIGEVQPPGKSNAISKLASLTMHGPAAQKHARQTVHNPASTCSRTGWPSRCDEAVWASLAPRRPLVEDKMKNEFLVEDLSSASASTSLPSPTIMSEARRAAFTASEQQESHYDLTA